MKNIEKYKDTLFDICVKNQNSFMVTKDGDICTCFWMIKENCKNCKFNKKFTSCKELKINWLNEDFIPTFYISQFDKTFLSALSEGYNYFCRVYDFGGTYRLITSKFKPKVEQGKMYKSIPYIDLTPFKIKLPFVGNIDHDEVWTLEEILKLPVRKEYNHEDA